MSGRVSGKSCFAVWGFVIRLLLALDVTEGIPVLLGAEDVGDDPPKPGVQMEKRSLGFQGRCVDERQKPLKNVKIRVFEQTTGSSKNLQRIRPLKLRTEVTTDGNGKFSIPHLEFHSAAGESMVPLIVATRDGKSSATFGNWSDIEIPEMATRDEGAPLPEKMTIILKSPIIIPAKLASLKGTVTDADGRPVAQAQVAVYAEGMSGSIPGMWSAQTDRDGNYSIDDLTLWKADPIVREFSEDGRSSSTVTPARKKLAVAHDDFPVTVRDIEEIPARVDVQLPPTVRLQGIVVDAVSGKPASNVVVKAKPISSPKALETATGIDGRYRLIVPRDIYSMWAEATDRVCVVNPVVDASSRQPNPDIDFRMVRGAIVTGRILGERKLQTGDTSNERLIGVGHHGPASVPLDWFYEEVMYASSDPIGLEPEVSVNADGTFRLRVAPGKNCVYLLGLSRRWNDDPYLFSAQDGEEVKIELTVPPATPEEMPANDDANVPVDDDAPRQSRRQAKPKYVEDPEFLAPSQMIELAKYNRKMEVIATEANGGKTPQLIHARIPSRPRDATAVNRLLDDLEAAQLDRISNLQHRVIKKIVDRGPAAIPELIEELDATQDPWMISKLGFILRAIDDRRAVPALIRAIPKAYDLSHLDIPEVQFGIRVRESLFCGQLASSDDPELAEFFQRHAISKSRKPGEWSFEPMMEEFFGALTHLTGARNGEWHLLRTHDPKIIPKVERRARAQAVADRWTQWWNIHQNDPAEPDLPIPEEAEAFEELRLRGTTPRRDGAFRRNPVGTLFNSRNTQLDFLLETATEFKHLRSLQLYNHGRQLLSEENWQHIGQLTSLEELTLSNFDVDDEGLEQIGKLQNLFKLSFRGNLNTTAEGWKQLHGLKQLSRLELFGVDAESLMEIAHLQTLESLSMSGESIDDEHLKAIGQMKGLQTLDLRRTTITDEGLAQLANLPNLTYLRLSHCGISGEGLKSLASLPKLISLNLVKTQVTGADMGALASVKTLESLSLAGTPLDDEGLQEIAKITSLKELYINNTAITDEGLTVLGSLKKLETLKVGETAVTPGAAFTLKQAIPKLEVDHRPDQRYDE